MNDTEYDVNYTGPKVRRARALGIALTPKAAEIMERRNYPPGQHGPAKRHQRSKMSDYKRQLLEKQRLRAQYNIHERQMRNYFRKAVRRAGNTADTLVQMLESRLDAIIYRGGLARTIYAARQYVTHRHVTVNGQLVNIPSYQVKEGDVVAIKVKSQTLPCFNDALQTANPPAYLSLVRDQYAVQLRYLPQRDEVPIICEMVQVIEFYAQRGG
jgi:small subunit ribosomal protein S4